MVIYRARDGVALLFDDGPNPKLTPKILEVLHEKGVKANFFLIGMKAEQAPDVTKQIVEAGHEIGNHTYTHKRLADLFKLQGKQAVINEVTRGRDAIASASGLDVSQIVYLRPPYLSWNYDVAKVVEPLYGENIVSSGLAIGDYDWGIDHNWDENNTAAISTHAKQIVDAWTEATENGTLLGFHDSSEHNLPGNKQYTKWMNRALPTLEALPTIIDNLHAKGFKICKLSDMELIKEQPRPGQNGSNLSK
jgi:peptidoglycan/xylan/chitin deacetylase (PgdA/CDA1 family)